MGFFLLKMPLICTSSMLTSTAVGESRGQFLTLESAIYRVLIDKLPIHTASSHPAVMDKEGRDRKKNVCVCVLVCACVCIWLSSIYANSTEISPGRQD